MVTPKSYLQSKEWAKFQAALGHEIVWCGENDDVLAIVEQGRFTSRLYVPYGPTVVSSEDLDKIIPNLVQIAAEYNLDFVRLEPSIVPNQHVLEKFMMKMAKRDVQPANTIFNDLTLNQDDIFASASQLPRRIWRKCEKAGVQFEVSYNPSDIQYFLDFIHEVEDRTGMSAHSDEYFKTMADTLFPTQTAGLLFATLDGEKVAAIVFLQTTDTFVYAHAGSKTQYRKLSPTTALAFHAMLFAKEQGCTRFDFFGVAPVGDTSKKWDSWQGFTKFKVSFGGTRVSLPGTYEIPLKRLKYTLFKWLS